ncbi:MAG: 50S ribosomal protein L18 [Spirochaetes bacterium]|nr:50S ribosomal protein L18 [Spirochaetota bacterium]
MTEREQIKASKIRRKMTIRKRVSGDESRPRLTITKSLRYISAQVIDDTKGVTIVSASTMEKDLKSGKNLEAAKTIGKLIGERALKKNVDKVVFDRNGLSYHGKVKALAEAAREAGLKF